MFLRRFNHGKRMEQTQLLSMKPFFEIPSSVHQFTHRLHAKERKIQEWDGVLLTKDTL
jgi:hypothetical protein